MMVNKRREESEKFFLSQSSDESDSDSDETDSEYDRDFPIPEDNPFGCYKTNLYFDRSDVPRLNTIFSTIDELFQSSETILSVCVQQVPRSAIHYRYFLKILTSDRVTS